MREEIEVLEQHARFPAYLVDAFDIVGQLHAVDNNFALAHGPAGLVSTLSATSPVLILPILWVATKEKPAPGAWIGAFLAVIGMACIFMA